MFQVKTSKYIYDNLVANLSKKKDSVFENYEAGTAIATLLELVDDMAIKSFVETLEKMNLT